MKIHNAKMRITTTKNPLYFQLGLHIGEDVAKEAGLSRAGVAFATVSKDELLALMSIGFKPFAAGEVEVSLYETPNEDPKKLPLLNFELQDASFTGGFGEWKFILDAVKAPRQPRQEGDPRPF